MLHLFMFTGHVEHNSVQDAIDFIPNYLSIQMTNHITLLWGKQIHHGV